MLKPLALVVSENLVLSNQIVNRLQDLGYRVQTLNSSGDLLSVARQSRPFLIITDLSPRAGGVLESLKTLRCLPEVAHTPVLGLTSSADGRFHAEAVAAGATLVVMESGVLGHLPQLLDQVLAVE